MTKTILDALRAKFNSDKLTAFANLNNYMMNSVGVGEHPDVVAECDKLVSAIADADGKLQILDQITPQEGGNQQ